MSRRQGRSEAATLGSDFQKVVMSIVNVFFEELFGRWQRLVAGATATRQNGPDSRRRLSRRRRIRSRMGLVLAAASWAAAFFAVAHDARLLNAGSTATAATGAARGHYPQLKTRTPLLFNPQRATLDAARRLASLYVTLLALRHFGLLFAFLLQHVDVLLLQLKRWYGTGDRNSALLVLLGHVLVAGVNADEYGLYFILITTDSDASSLSIAGAMALAAVLAHMTPESVVHAQQIVNDRASADGGVMSMSTWIFYLVAAALTQFAASHFERKVNSLSSGNQVKAQLVYSSTGMMLAIIVAVSEFGWFRGFLSVAACGLILYVLVDRWRRVNNSFQGGEAYLDTYRSSTEYGSAEGGMTAHVLAVLWAKRASRQMLIFLSINVAFMFVELAVGLYTNSLGLMGDAGHMLFDNGALVIGLVASYIGQLPPDAKFTYGYGRVEVLSGFLNSLLLLVVSFHLITEAASRFMDPPEVTTDHLLLTDSGGCGSGHGHSHGISHHQAHGEDASEDGHHGGNSNMYGVYLHVLADTLGSVGVIISSILIHLYEWHVADSASSALISLLILGSTLPLLRDTARQLLQGAPQELESSVNAALQEVQASVPGVERIAQWNIWHHAGDMPLLRCILRLPTQQMNREYCNRPELFSGVMQSWTSSCLYRFQSLRWLPQWDRKPTMSTHENPVSDDSRFVASPELPLKSHHVHNHDHNHEHGLQFHAASTSATPLGSFPHVQQQQQHHQINTATDFSGAQRWYEYEHDTTTNVCASSRPFSDASALLHVVDTRASQSLEPIRLPAKLRDRIDRAQRRANAAKDGVSIFTKDSKDSAVSVPAATVGRRTATAPTPETSTASIHKMRDFEARANAGGNVALFSVEPADRSLQGLSLEDRERVMLAMQAKIRQIASDVDANFARITKALDANGIFDSAANIQRAQTLCLVDLQRRCKLDKLRDEAMREVLNLPTLATANQKGPVNPSRKLSQLLRPISRAKSTETTAAVLNSTNKRRKRKPVCSSKLPALNTAGKSLNEKSNNQSSSSPLSHQQNTGDTDDTASQIVAREEVGFNSMAAGNKSTNDWELYTRHSHVTQILQLLATGETSNTKGSGAFNVNSAEADMDHSRVLDPVDEWTQRPPSYQAVGARAAEAVRRCGERQRWDTLGHFRSHCSRLGISAAVRQRLEGQHGAWRKGQGTPRSDNGEEVGGVSDYVKGNSNQQQRDKEIYAELQANIRERLIANERRTRTAAAAVRVVRTSSRMRLPQTAPAKTMASSSSMASLPVGGCLCFKEISNNRYKMKFTRQLSVFPCLHQCYQRQWKAFLKPHLPHHRNFRGLVLEYELDTIVEDEDERDEDGFNEEIYDQNDEDNSEEGEEREDGMDYDEDDAESVDSSRTGFSARSSMSMSSVKRRSSNGNRKHGKSKRPPTVQRRSSRGPGGRSAGIR
ncbi:Cation efflux protein transmembrane domain [Phytophthora cactorum]|nr:Cation efflux protein transmembrane domain [Phytophthora cactorum]